MLRKFITASLNESDFDTVHCLEIQSELINWLNKVSSIRGDVVEWLIWVYEPNMKQEQFVYFRFAASLDL